MSATDEETGEGREKAQDAGVPAPPGAKKPSRLKHLLMTLLTVAIVVVVFCYVLPRFASYSSVFKALGELSIWELALLFAVSVFNLACAWTMNQASLPGLSNRKAAQLTLSQNLISSTLPLGGAWSVGLGYEIIHSYGFGVADFSLMLGVSGIWNTFAKLALPVVALLLVVVTGEAEEGLASLAIAGLVFLLVAVAAFALILWKRSLAARIGEVAGRIVSRLLRPFHKGPVSGWGEGLARFRDRTVSVARTRWLMLTVVAITYQLSTFLVYLLSLRFSGVPASGADGVSWVVAFGVFAIVRVISAIPVTPGAVGIAEASYTALMVAAGGSEPAVVAGVLMFRALTWLMPIALGLPVYAAWWAGRRKAKKAEAPQASTSRSRAEEEA